ncbi:MAG TPA: hypothetical protein DEG47_09470, partial [Cyanobacteria bacterium UBA11148]|nr:hypothetical protein [Cyanobacteria bacterium UBA11148]
MLQTLIKSKIQNPLAQRRVAQSKINIISWQYLRQHLFSISPEEATFARRGFHSSNIQTQQQLEQIGHTFLQGYHEAIANPEPETLIPQLNTVTTELRGFAFEGAAMGLALLDILTPWKSNRVQMFLADAGANHIYMVYVGMGWALARIPFSLEHYLTQLNQKTAKKQTLSHPLYSYQPNPKSISVAARSAIQNPKSIDSLLGWLAIDGYGFHQGYFYPSQYVQKQALPKKLSGYSRRVFDQGLGRSLWFVYGADIPGITNSLLTFHPDRLSDLWSGIGLACTYAGGVDGDAIKALKIAAGNYQHHLAQGAAFAAKARQRAGNLTPHTELACQLLCGMSSDAAAEITDIALENLSPEEETPAYEVWRRRIQGQFQL